MKQVDKISLTELQQMAEKMFGSLVKADENSRNYCRGSL
jgi:hypothetical protein